MARIEVPEGPGGDAAMVWSLRPEMAGMVERMIATAYSRSILDPTEREVARMRIAELNACEACATFRAPSVVDAGVTADASAHVSEWRTWPGYTDRQRLAIEFAERFAVDHRAIDDEWFARLRAGFTDRRSSTSRCAARCSSVSVAPSRCSRSPRRSTAPSDARPSGNRARSGSGGQASSRFWKSAALRTP